MCSETILFSEKALSATVNHAVGEVSQNLGKVKTGELECPGAQFVSNSFEIELVSSNRGWGKFERLLETSELPHSFKGCISSNSKVLLCISFLFALFETFWDLEFSLIGRILSKNDMLVSTV